MKFNKIKCQVLPLWKNSTMHKYTLGADWLKDNLAKKDQSEGPSDRKFEMCHYVRQQPLGLLQAECCQQVNGGDPCPLLSLDETHFGLVLGFPVQERQVHPSSSPVKGRETDEGT